MVAPRASRQATTKWGGANFLGHSNDGFKATCVIEYEQDNNGRISINK